MAMLQLNRILAKKNMFAPVYPLVLVLLVLLLTACASTSALEQYQSKADEGDVQSQLMLAQSYFFGTKEIPQNKALAMQYYRLASTGGSSVATFSLGRISENDGQFEQAIHYYELAAADNNPAAQDNLAIMYQQGRGVAKNLAKAEALFLSALANGSQYSKRNLAVLYRDSGQQDKAMVMFKEMAFDPTSDNNSYRFKKAVALQIMDFYLAQNDDKNAYVWGATAVLSGLFDGDIEEAKAKRDRYLALTSRLSDDDKNHLAKDVLQHHFKVFQQYDKAIQQAQAFKVSDGLILLPMAQALQFKGYTLRTQKTLYDGLDHFKDKQDRRSRINFAIYTLRMASYDISVGAIKPYLWMAKADIHNAMTILQAYDDNGSGRLAELKKNTELKLKVVERVADYQEKISKRYEEKHSLTVDNS